VKSGAVIVTLGLSMLLSGCGDAAKSPAQPSENKGSTSTAPSTGTGTAAPPTPPPPPPPPPAPPPPASGLSKDEFDAALKSITALEEDGDFSAAIKKTRELEKTVNAQQSEALSTVVDRLKEENRASAEAKFSIKALTDAAAASIAREKLKAAGNAGRILLRKAVLTDSDEVAAEAFALLVSLEEPGIPKIVAARIKNASPALRTVLLNGLKERIAHIDADVQRALFAIVKSAPEQQKDLAALLALSVPVSDRMAAGKFNEIFGDPGAFELFKKLRVLINVPGDGLVLYFSFDELAGDAVQNQAATGGTGKVTGASLVPGKVGSALSFNGTDNVVTVDNKPELEVGKDGADLSVAFWFLLKSGNNGGWRNITHKGNANEERTFAMWMHPDNNLILFVISTTGGNVDSNSASQIALNTWTHIAYVKSGDKIRLYINGKQDAENTLAAPAASNTGPIYIGKDQWHGGTECLIDEYCIYNRALKESELADMSAGK